MIEALCIDSSNKPKEIPLGKWIQKGYIYHITHVYYHKEQGIQGCDLKEVHLGEESKPYETYRLNRFAVTKDNLLKLIEMIKDCSELNDFDVQELIKESELVVKD